MGSSFFVNYPCCATWNTTGDSAAALNQPQTCRLIHMIGKTALGSRVLDAYGFQWSKPSSRLLIHFQVSLSTQGNLIGKHILNPREYSRECRLPDRRAGSARVNDGGALLTVAPYTSHNRSINTARVTQRPQAYSPPPRV